MSCIAIILTPSFPDGSTGTAGGPAGGDLTGTYPNPSIAPVGIHGRTEKTTTDGGDELLIRDAVTGELRRITRTNFLVGIGYTDEQAQDAVGGILASSATIALTYDDGAPSIGADVVDGSITSAKLANQAVTFTKVQNIATARLLGRFSAGSGSVEEIAIGAGLTLAGTLSVTGLGSILAPVFSFPTSIAGTTTEYAAPFLIDTDAAEAIRQIPMPRATTLRDLRVLVAGTQPSDGALAVTVRKNGVDTLLQVTVPPGLTTGQYADTVNAATFAQGDALSISVTNNASSGSCVVKSIALIADA